MTTEFAALADAFAARYRSAGTKIADRADLRDRLDILTGSDLEAFALDMLTEMVARRLGISEG